MISPRPLSSEPRAEADERYFEALRRAEFAQLDRHGLAYLDYAGAALVARSQIEAHDRLLRDQPLGNPHSEHRPSRAATEAIEAARRKTLAFLGVDESTHVAIFTANASAALRLVGESYPFGGARGLVLTADNHNSVNGLREPARRARSPVAILPVDTKLRLESPEARLAELARSTHGLFALPAQSNFSGVRHSLAIVAAARGLGFDTLLDAAAFVPTARLDLATVPADFVVLSFYKIFGFPTGVGALVARREALDRLIRPSFAGGTVLFASVAADRHRLREGAAGFEDGTPNFLGIAALDSGFGFVDRIGIDRIGRRVAALTGELIAGLAALRHPNGAPRVRFHGPVESGAPDDRGGTVAFNLLGQDGEVEPYWQVEAAARDAGICLRGGCFCNPGAAEAALGLDGASIADALRELDSDFTPGRFANRLARPVGALRLSLGAATTRGDLARVLDLLCTVASRPGVAPARRSAATTPALGASVARLLRPG
jgi:selenocysteine lyase/cysteine desulfurase